MLRGLDTRVGPDTDDEPSIIKVAGRANLEGDATIYVDDAASGSDKKRQEKILEEFDRLQAAGVLEATTVVTWQDADAMARYEEFADTAGETSLEPFFETLAEGNALDVPAVCVAIYDDETLTGLYPTTANGVEQHVEDCLRALSSGDCVENVA